MTSIEEQMYNAEFMANPYFINKDGAAVVSAHQVGFDNGAKWRKAVDDKHIEELEVKLAQTSCYEEGLEEVYAAAKKEIIDKACEWLDWFLQEKVTTPDYEWVCKQVTDFRKAMLNE